MGGKTKRPKFADDVDTATCGEVRRFVPSQVRASHDANQRFAPYDTMPELRAFIGAKCCFTPAQIEGRLASFLTEGQIDAIKVSMSGTGHPDLEVGFLRHCAFLLAEVRGLIEKIPGAKGTKVSGIRAEVVKAPKDQDDRASQARRNFAENYERQDLSPVDKALYFKRRLAAMREDGTQITKEELAAEVARSVDHVNKHLRLFACLRPEELLAVHEGTTPMSVALKRASDRGSGNNPGPRGTRTCVKHSNISRALKLAETRTPPVHVLGPAQLVQLAAILAGEALAVACEDEGVVAWANWLDADKSEEPSTKPKKKKEAPPTIDEQVAT